MSFDRYQRTVRFPALDGLRAVSILLVLLFHIGSPRLAWLNGRLGVTVFFVLSGHLITTLLLREQERAGRISLRRFYLRRAFRILPLYYAVLALYLSVYVALGVGDRAGDLERSLPWFVSYMNDFRPGILHGSTPYQQSWSLGVEEKFYLAWPLLAFVLLARRRATLAAAAAVAPIVLYLAGDATWFAYYGQIMVGCLLAVAMHHETGFRMIAQAARGPIAIVAASVLLLVQRHHPGPGLAFPFAVAVVIGGLVSGGPGSRLLALRPAVWIGERAYAVYLIHLLALLATLHLAERLHVAGTGRDLLMLTVGGAVSFAAADLLRSRVELPMIQFGRRLAEGHLAHRSSAPASQGVRLERI